MPLLDFLEEAIASLESCTSTDKCSSPREEGSWFSGWRSPLDHPRAQSVAVKLPTTEHYDHLPADVTADGLSFSGWRPSCVYEEHIEVIIRLPGTESKLVAMKSISDPTPGLRDLRSKRYGSSWSVERAAPSREQTRPGLLTVSAGVGKLKRSTSSDPKNGLVAREHLTPTFARDIEDYDMDNDGP